MRPSEDSRPLILVLALLAALALCPGLAGTPALAAPRAGSPDLFALEEAPPLPTQGRDKAGRDKPGQAETGPGSGEGAVPEFSDPGRPGASGAGDLPQPPAPAAASTPAPGLGQPPLPPAGENLFGRSLDSLAAEDARAFAYLKDQDEHLALCRTRCPDLAPGLDLAASAFSLALAPARTALEESWGPGVLGRFQAAYRVRGNRTLPPDLCGRCKLLSRRMESPLEGGMPLNVLGTLVLRHPAYAARPDREMDAGWRRTWRSTGREPGGRGLVLSFEHPLTWLELKNMPIALVALAGGLGAGPGWMMVRAAPLPQEAPAPAGAPGPDKARTPARTPDGDLDRGVAQELKMFGGYRVLAMHRMDVAGLPARTLTGEWAMKVRDRTALVRMRSHWMVKDRTLVSLHFAVGAGREGDFRARAGEAFARLEPVFDRMAASLRFGTRDTPAP